MLVTHWTRRSRKHFLQFWIFLVVLLVFYRWVDCLYREGGICIPSIWSSWGFDSLVAPKAGTELEVYEVSGRLTRTPKRSNTDPTVNLVVASVAKDDISWTSHVSIPNMAVVRYVSDDPAAAYHPSKPVGRESLMYFTYMHDFYDELPDISIFVHADETPWHVEPILRGNLSHALSRLDLEHVKQRKYVNLRVSWVNACPDWINTTHTVPGSEHKEEEPFMAQAFVDNFRPWHEEESKEKPKGDFVVPEILAQPCCNQFAATRSAIRSVPIIEYKRFMEWLTTSSLATSSVGDFAAGRFWEHAFQFLFTGKPVDCPNEWKAFCLVYGICFENDSNMYGHMQLEQEKTWLLKELGFWKEIMRPFKSRATRKRISEIRAFHEESLEDADARG